MSLLVLALTNLGRVEIAAHRYASAAETLNAAAMAARRPLASDPASGTGKEQLLAALTWMVHSELKLGKIAEADRHAAEALDLAGELARHSPENSEVQTALGRIQTAVGDVALAQRRPREAASAYGQARHTFGELLRRSPRVVDFQTGLARAYAQEADALDAARGAPSSSAQPLRHVAQRILEELRREGRLYPEDVALLTSVDARARQTRRQVAISAP
jgi:tetratricopeptide (TPR) repeat protein